MITTLSRMGRVICLGVDEIIDLSQIKDTLIDLPGNQVNLEEFPMDGEQGYSLRQTAWVQQALVRTFGLTAGLGLAIRSGRASFRYILREFGPELAFDRIEYRLLPLKERIQVGLDSIAGLLNKDFGQRVWVDKEDDHLLWTMEYSAGKVLGDTTRSICHLVIGIIQEALCWISGGKTYHVEEVCCSEQGNPTCTLRIQLEPVI